MKRVCVYTDGSCDPNPGVGGWCSIIIYRENELELCGFEDSTTNNRMELLATFSALQRLKEQCIVDLYTDSQYVMNGFVKKWVYKWQRNGWTKADKQKVLNKDLWEVLIKEVSRHEINWNWVRGHTGDRFNERCDFIAKQARIRQLSGENIFKGE